MPSYGRMMLYLCPELKRKIVMDKIKIKPRLKQDYQLSNYCPTEGNYIAVQAAKTVISEWGKSWFNPLLLLGPTGCGKTHLLHAIGNEILKNSPDICVLYVCALEYKNMYMDESGDISHEPERKIISGIYSFNPR